MNENMFSGCKMSSSGCWSSNSGCWKSPSRSRQYRFRLVYFDFFFFARCWISHVMCLVGQWKEAPKVHRIIALRSLQRISSMRKLLRWTMKIVNWPPKIIFFSAKKFENQNYDSKKSLLEVLTHRYTMLYYNKH